MYVLRFSLISVYVFLTMIEFMPKVLHLFGSHKHRTGAITFALILQKFRSRLSYTCAHKSGAFALSFGVTLARIFSQLFLGQLLVFEPRC